jgi:hypothetical protein
VAKKIRKQGTIEITIPEEELEKTEEEEKKATEPATLDVIAAKFDQLIDLNKRVLEALAEKAKKPKEKYPPCPEKKSEEAEEPEPEVVEEEEIDWDTADLEELEKKGKLPKGLREWIERHRKKKEEEIEEENETEKAKKKPEKYPYKEEKAKKPEKYPYKEEKAKKPEKYPYKEEEKKAEEPLEPVTATTDLGDIIQRAIDEAIAKRLGKTPVKKRSLVPQEEKIRKSVMDFTHEELAVLDTNIILKQLGIEEYV